MKENGGNLLTGRKRYDNLIVGRRTISDDISTRRSNEPREERNWRVAGANDLTMPSFCPIMDRLLSPWIPAIVRISRHVAVQIEFVPFRSRAFARYGFTSSYTSAASTGGGGGRGGDVRGGVPPISTFRSIRLLVRGGKGGCYSTEGTSCPSVPFLPFNSLSYPSLYIVVLPILPSSSSPFVVVLASKALLLLLLLLLPFTREKEIRAQGCSRLFSKVVTNQRH